MSRVTLLSVGLLFTVMRAHALQPAAVLVDGGIGGYHGRPSSASGSLTYLRMLTPLGTRGFYGARFEYRDDPTIDGHAATVGLGAEGALHFPLSIGGFLFIPAGISLESERLSGTPRPRITTGIGLTIPLGPMQLALELRGSLASQVSYISETIGIRTRPDAARGAAGTVYIYGSRIDPQVADYQRAPGREGLGFAWQFPVDSLFRITELRASIGVESLQYRQGGMDSNSEVYYAFLGPAFELLNIKNVFVLHGVPQLGAVHFARGNVYGNWGVQGSLDATLGWSRFHLHAALATIFSRGPIGPLAASQYRAGVSLRL